MRPPFFVGQVDAGNQPSDACGGLPLLRHKRFNYSIWGCLSYPPSSILHIVHRTLVLPPDVARGCYSTIHRSSLPRLSHVSRRMKTSASMFDCKLSPPPLLLPSLHSCLLRVKPANSNIDSSVSKIVREALRRRPKKKQNTSTYIFFYGRVLWITVLCEARPPPKMIMLEETTSADCLAQ